MRYVIPVLATLYLSTSLSAEEITEQQIRSAVEQAIPWLEKASAGSSKENKCFTCHNHALPVLALTEAKQLGFSVDEDNLSAQLQHILAHLKRGEKGYLDGKGQGGQVLTAGYALWALEVGGLAHDATTDAVTGYLLKRQSDKDHWSQKGTRPPSDGNEFTTTYVALRGLKSFTPAAQNESKETRFSAVAKWLSTTQPADTEDAVFRLKSLRIVQNQDTMATSAVEELLRQQKPDGGWRMGPNRSDGVRCLRDQHGAGLPAESRPIKARARSHQIRSPVFARQAARRWNMARRHTSRRISAVLRNWIPAR